MPLSKEQEERYTPLIDEILAASDLTTISTKKVRVALQEKTGDDFSDELKDPIKNLITVRFNLAEEKANADADTTPSSPESPLASSKPKPATNGTSKPKSRKSVDEDADAKLAAKLQAQELRTARPTRGGEKRKAPAKKSAAVKKRKSSAKVKSADDSDLELNSDGEKVEKKKTGAFHKEYALSESLASLVGAERLSRPQVVKKLWVHIKAKELQDPNDKRNILCDEGMRKVFDKDTVHMFTMNKLLGKHLYPLPEGEGEEVKDEVKSETKVEDDSS